MINTVDYVQAVARHSGWGGIKWYLSERLGMSDDALHVHAGLAILLVAAVLWRRPPWHWVPWMSVVLLEAANEAVDLFGHTAGEDTLAGSLHDGWMTLVWPTVILLVFPRLVRRYRTPD